MVIKFSDRHGLRKFGPYLCFILYAIFLIAPQIYDHSLILGADSLFHMNRFYETYQQIKTGNFSYFQMLYGFQQTGRVVNALYGPLFTYLMGLLLLLLGSWYKFQLVTDLLVFVVAGSSMFYLAKTLKMRTAVATLIAMLYMTATTSIYWGISQNFTAIGAAVLPFVLRAGLRMTTDHKRPLTILGLALPVAILLQIHLLSGLIGVLALVPFLIAGLMTAANRSKMLQKLGGAILLVVGLTGNIWGAVIDVMFTNKLISPFPNDLTASVMKFSTNSLAFTDFGLYFSLLFIAQCMLTVFYWHKLAGTEKVLNLTGALFLILSTGLFPWRISQLTFPMLRTFLQFPERFAVIANILLLAGLGLNINRLLAQQHQLKRLVLTIGATVVLLLGLNVNQMTSQSAGWWASKQVVSYAGSVQYMTQDKHFIRRAFKSRQLDWGLKLIVKASPDYLPTRTIDGTKFKHYARQDPYGIYSKQVIRNKLKLTRKVIDHHTLQVTWTSAKQKWVQLPLIKYAHSAVTLNGQRLAGHQMKTSNIGALSVPAKKGTNVLTLKYVPGLPVIGAAVLTVLTWLGVLLAQLSRSRRRARLKSRHN
ncbi:hypothetical protein [Loigolactobacillus binensis]|uniref:Cell division protein n=1 Tax=Loigolactobacillus binensis TaxID=2559922 RepID=A0ABW3EDY5_9LACO|nr:hypothetical protein [Loigolactobacillus binensis]